MANADPARPELRFFFDAGAGVCLWAGNEAAESRHDFAVDVDELPLSGNTRDELRRLMAWYDTSIDWDDPAGASPWSAEENQRFNAAVQAVVPRLEQELAAAGYDLSDESCTGPAPDTPFILLARIFTVASDAARAAAQGEALLATLAPFSPSQAEPPEPYWKIPGWYEHTLDLSPADTATFDAVVALTKGHWEITRDSECNAVWNPEPGCQFLLSEVRWAEILLIRPNPPTPDQEYLPS